MTATFRRALQPQDIVNGILNCSERPGDTDAAAGEGTFACPVSGLLTMTMMYFTSLS
jgi:hypothetical protein